MAIAGSDVGLIIGIEKVRFDLACEVLGIQAPIVQLVENVLVEQPSTSEHDDPIEVTRILTVQLLGLACGSDPAGNSPVRHPGIQAVGERLSPE
ncbi:hypothetical protein D9M70_538620 [compost metagenome]